MKNFYKNKKVLVTGHTGFKGTWLALMLNVLGADVYGYSLAPPTNPAMFDLTNCDEHIISCISDILNYNDLFDFMSKVKPEIIFHLAAQPIVRLSYENPIETFSTNIMGTANILQVSRNISSVKAIVAVTTDKVYENKDNGILYNEDDRLGGYDPYSSSKVAAETVINSYQKSYKLNVASARAGNVIGGGDYSKDRIIPDCIRAAKNNDEILVRNPYSIRPYQHVLEALDGYLILAERLYEDPLKYAQAFNFGPNAEACVTTQKLVDVFCNAWGNGIKWVEQKLKDSPHEAQLLALDNKKSADILNWKPKLSLDKTIELVVEWERAENKFEITEKQILKYLGE